MSKKNNGGKKTIATVKNAAKKQENKVNNVQTKADEKKPVDTKKEEKKNPNSVPPTQKPVAAPPKDVVQAEEVEVVKPNTTNNNNVEESDAELMRNALSRGSKKGLSADGRVRLLDLAHRVYVEEQNPELMVPEPARKSMNLIVQAGIIAAIADETVNGDSMFSVVLKKSCYPRLCEVAKDMGITLPSIKLLEANTSAEDAEQGNISIPIGKGSGVKVSPEAKKQIKHEKEVQTTPPELNPTKITSEEDLRKALEYLTTIRGKKAGQTIVDVVDFMRNYRMNQASKAENSTEAMQKLDQRTTAAWLDDVFQYVKPSFLMSGIGRGMASSVDFTGSPIRAFTILKESIINENGESAWDDRSIADAVTCMIKWVKLAGIDADKANLEKLGDPKKYDTNAKEIAQKYHESIDLQKSIVNNTLSAPSAFMEKFEENYANKDKNAVTLFAIVRKLYYPETVDKPIENYKNLYANIIERIGILFNMFRPDGDKFGDFSESRLTSLEEYSTEEIAAQKKANLEVKKTKIESKKDLFQDGHKNGSCVTNGNKSRHSSMQKPVEYERILLLKNNQLSKLSRIMKKNITLLCCIALAIFGGVVGFNNNSLSPPGTMTVSAADIPLDLKLGMVRTIRDTVYIPSDTVYLPGKRVVVTKTKEVPVPYKISTTDTMYVPMVFIVTQEVREEQTSAKHNESPIDSIAAENDTKLLE